MLAQATGVPELAVTDEEGKSFMDAAANVMRHYSVVGTQKTMDWVAFASCCAGIYGPRAFLLISKRRTPHDHPKSPRDFGGQSEPFPPRPAREPRSSPPDNPDMISSPLELEDEPGIGYAN